MQIRIRHLYRAAPETVQRAMHDREPLFLCPKIRMQPLLEIYTAEVRFTRKIVSEDKITQIQGFVVQTDALHRHRKCFPMLTSANTIP
jgi:hypothetical protein